MQTKAPVYNGRIMQKRVVVCIGKIGWGNKTTHKMYAIFISITKKLRGTIENNNQNSMQNKTTYTKKLLKYTTYQGCQKLD